MSLFDILAHVLSVDSDLSGSGTFEHLPGVPSRRPSLTSSSPEDIDTCLRTIHHLHHHHHHHRVKKFFVFHHVNLEFQYACAALLELLLSNRILSAESREGLLVGILGFNTLLFGFNMLGALIQIISLIFS